MIENWIRRSNTESKGKKFKILTFPTHERFETNLAETGHEFYSFPHPDFKMWDSSVPPPENYNIMPKGLFYPSDGYDFILTQNRYGQFGLAQELNKMLQIPVISLEHACVNPSMDYNTIQKLSRMVGDVNIFTSEYSASSWNAIGVSRNINIIEYCVDSDLFAPNKKKRHKQVLTVNEADKGNDVVLNYSGWERITEKLPSKLIDLSIPYTLEELVKEYNSSSVYLNTTLHHPCPIPLLEAMSCGCAVVALDACGLSKVIEHGVNGMVSENEHEVIEYCNLLLNDEKLAKTLGENARQTILERFNKERFINEWNEIFQKTYEASI
jgi:glycosyltransferase involved in cell wall biosynthesis